jgi:hypothetical protein
VKSIILILALASSSAFAEGPVQVSNECLSTGVKAVLVNVVRNAAAKDLVGVGLDLQQGQAVYVEGDDILVPVKTIFEAQTISDWYYVRVLRARSCLLAKPVLYQN